MPSPLPRVRKLCLALPEAHEVEAWGEPTFRVKNKLFAMFASASNHHGGGRDAIWCKAAPGNQELMISLDPDRFFRPPYVGPSGWVGMWLDKRVAWGEVAEVLRDSYLLVAPKKLVMVLTTPTAKVATKRPAPTSTAAPRRPARQSAPAPKR